MFRNAHTTDLKSKQNKTHSFIRVPILGNRKICAEWKKMTGRITLFFMSFSYLACPKNIELIKKQNRGHVEKCPT